MSSHLNSEWDMVGGVKLDETLASKAEGYEASIAHIDSIRSSGLPSFVYVLSNEEKPRPKNAKTSKTTDFRTKQAKDCKTAWDELFNRMGDYSVYVPGRFFNFVKLEVTDVKKDGNPYLYSDIAPVLLLTHKDGSVAQVFEGRAKIKGNYVIRGMCKILQEDGFAPNTRVFGQLSNILKLLERVEGDLVKAGEDLAEEEKKLTGYRRKDMERARKKNADVKDSPGTLSARKGVDRCATVVLQKQVAKYKVLCQEFTLLEEAGVPPKRMPDKPKDPASASSSK